MERQELEKKVLECVAISYNKSLGEISLETKFKEDLGGASLLMVGLVSQVENELDVLIQLPVAASCDTVKEFVDKVEELL